MNWIHQASSFIWGIPMILILLSTHLFTTIHLKGIQFHFIRQIKAFFMHKKNDIGEISQLSALFTILASTMGTGNIIGVSTALLAGGPGSVFWMAFAGLFGMATKYAETWLSVQYRERQPDGTFLGGPMVVLKEKHPILSAMFAIFTSLAALGIGCSVQSNAASLMLKNTFCIPVYATGVILSVLTYFVIINGIQRISSFCNFLVPAAGILYLSSCGLLLWINHEYLTFSIQLILESAFTPKSIASGFLGSTMLSSMKYGVSRGLFTNEAGMGSTPILSASAQCSDSKTPSYIAMLSVFIDTVVLCTLTGVVFISCCLHINSLTSIKAADVFSLTCFSLIPVYGKPVLCIAVVLFALSTILGWCTVGERCFSFLFGKSSLLPYRYVWILFVFLGSILNLEMLWSISDIFNALMCIPNIYMIILYTHHIKT